MTVVVENVVDESLDVLGEEVLESEVVVFDEDAVDESEVEVDESEVDESEVDVGGGVVVVDVVDVVEVVVVVVVVVELVVVLVEESEDVGSEVVVLVDEVAFDELDEDEEDEEGEDEEDEEAWGELDEEPVAEEEEVDDILVEADVVLFEDELDDMAVIGRAGKQRGEIKGDEGPGGDAGGARCAGGARRHISRLYALASAAGTLRPLPGNPNRRHAMEHKTSDSLCRRRTGLAAAIVSYTCVFLGGGRCRRRWSRRQETGPPFSLHPPQVSPLTSHMPMPGPPPRRRLPNFRPSLGAFARVRVRTMHGLTTRYSPHVLRLFAPGECAHIPLPIFRSSPPRTVRIRSATSTHTTSRYQVADNLATAPARQSRDAHGLPCPADPGRAPGPGCSNTSRHSPNSNSHPIRTLFVNSAIASRQTRTPILPPKSGSIPELSRGPDHRRESQSSSCLVQSGTTGERARRRRYRTGDTPDPPRTVACP